MICDCLQLNGRLLVWQEDGDVGAVCSHAVAFPWWEPSSFC